jgi:hypothetical protein
MWERKPAIELREIFIEAEDQEYVTPLVIRMIKLAVAKIVLDAKNDTMEKISHGRVGLNSGGSGEVMYATNIREAEAAEQRAKTFSTSKTFTMPDGGVVDVLGPTGLGAEANSMVPPRDKK